MEKLSLQELQPLILDWAREKNLLFEENAPKQRLKLIEECGELASAILKNDIKLQKDAIGDIFVVLIISAEQTNNGYINFDWGSDYEEFENYELFDLISSVIGYTDEIDTLFWLHAICHKLNFNITECANLAWNEIKDRKGNTVNGTFIKN